MKTEEEVLLRQVRKVGGRCRVLPYLSAGILAGLLVFSGKVPQSMAAHGDSPISGNFIVERLDLKFEDGSTTKVLTEGDVLKAKAEITFKGSGLLAGAWEVAEPTTTPGSPQFRNLLIINKNLAANRQETLWSPALPTATAGSYILRLSLNRPKLQDDAPVIKYFVGKAPGEDVLQGRKEIPDSISALGPSTELPAKMDTKFSWDPVPGSVAYQVEIYNKTGKERGVMKEAGKFNACLIRVPSELNRPPMMGVMVPAYHTETTLNQLAGSVLDPNTAYLWRVVAVDKDGKVLCESPFKEFIYLE